MLLPRQSLSLPLRAQMRRPTGHGRPERPHRSRLLQRFLLRRRLRQLWRRTWLLQSRQWVETPRLLRIVSGCFGRLSELRGATYTHIARRTGSGVCSCGNDKAYAQPPPSRRRRERSICSVRAGLVTWVNQTMSQPRLRGLLRTIFERSSSPMGAPPLSFRSRTTRSTKILMKRRKANLR